MKGLEKGKRCRISKRIQRDAAALSIVRSGRKVTALPSVNSWLKGRAPDARAVLRLRSEF